MKLSEAMTSFDLARRTEVEDSTLVVYAYTFAKLSAYLGDVEIEEITVDDLRRWRAQLSKLGLSVYTLHRDMRQTRTFFNWCVDEGLLEHSPAARLALPKLPRGEPPKAISDLDMERMIEAAREGLRERPEVSTGKSRSVRQGQKPYPYERDYAIVRFLAETGCRVGGLVGLRLGDLELETREATVREKGQKSRRVNFGQETAQALRFWLVVRPRNKHADFVFIGERGPLTTSGVYQILMRLAERAGVEGRHNPHSFRHALARRMLKHKADMGTVSQVLGHSDIETTHRFYARWTGDELAKRHRDFGGLLD